MERDAFLSLNTSGRSARRTTVGPSPVLDLVYACFHLLGERRREGREPLEWAAEVAREAPEVASAAADLADPVDGAGPGRILFPLAIEFGHVGDEDPGAFLEALPERAAALHEQLAREPEGEDDGDTARRMLAWLERPPRPDWADHARDTLRALWARIGPYWERRGRADAEAAASEVRAGLREHDDVLRALPAHHFAQFETLAPSLRTAHAQGRLWVVPLAFASAGGFHLEGEEIVALGFGLHAERMHASAERRVAAAAAGAKALADPTRLMLLHLVVRFENLTLTVGDLAQQLGVSQPTVSGHLKLLREAGLVTTERQGNRTLPKPVPEAIRELLEALSDVFENDLRRG